MADLSLPPRPGSSSPRGTSTRDWEELSSALLEDGFILTALELYTELLEAGKDVASLRDYFSNPGNFENALPQFPTTGLLHSMVRASSHSTLDSMEFGRYSDDLDKETNDRVAVLEFELRKALETIKSLRGSLTKATGREGDPSKKVISKSNEPIKPHEKRALNFLAHEYLMQQDNKLTAITFTEENGDQDFDDWDDVGLNTSKPPDLLCLFRNYSNAMLSDKEKLNRIEALEDQVAALTGENLALKRETEALLVRQKKNSLSSSPSVRKHKRGGSLNNKLDADVPPLPPRNRSSPDISELVVSPPESAVQMAHGEETKKVPDAKLAEHNREELSMSTNSARSDATLVVNPEDHDKDKRTISQSGSIDGAPQAVITKERSVSSPSTSSDCNDRDNATPSRLIGESGHQMSLLFRQELLNVCQTKTDSRIGVEVAKLSDPDLDIVQLLGRCLPYIVPNISLAKREEVIPILLVVLAKHPDSKARDQLMNIMFNLIKRPDKNQRMVIMSSCVAFAKLTGGNRVETELLPQMWEQINEKYSERRLLVAESCGVLAPYIPSELRGSLVLSMLKQMLSEDPAESVRQAVARSLGIIVAFTDDEAKFSSCWELLLKAITDRSQLVVSTTYSVLLPALAAWAFELGTLEKDMLSYFLHQLLTCVKQVNRSDGDSGAVEQSQHHILTLTHLIPWHLATILLSGPYRDTLPESEKSTQKVTFPKPSSPLLDIEVIIGDSSKLALLVAAFQREVSSGSYKPWTSLEWFQNEFLNKLVRVLVALGFEQPELVHTLILLLSNYCIYLGHTYTHAVIIPFFEVCLKLPSQNAGKALAEGSTKVTTPVLVAYLAGVLATFTKDEKLLCGYLRSIIVDMALYFAPVDSLTASLSELKRDRKLHIIVLGVLQELAHHSSFQVRRYVATLYGVMVRGVEESLMMKTVVPQLTKLARDSEISVRVDTIASFGTIMETATSKDILVCVHKQFELFVAKDLSYVDHQLLMGVLKTLAKIGPRADPVFRDEFIIPRLGSIAEANNVSSNVTKRRDVIDGLLEAYKNIAGCFISVDLIVASLLPGLECLERDIKELHPDKTSTVADLISKCNSKITEYQKQDQSAEASGVGGMSGLDKKASAFFSKLKPNFDRKLSYVQGQSPSSKKREYFYFIDHQGQLFLDDTKVKNFITCFKDKKFLAFFFHRVKPNTSGRYQDEFPFVSPCGPEMNYICCDDLPIVYTHMLDHDGQVIEDVETYGQTEPVIQSTNVLGNHGLTNLEDSLSQKVGERDSKRSTNSLRVESVVERLSYGGTGNILSLPFEPEKLCMLPESGRVYHTGPEYLGGVGLVKSNLAIELSRFFVYSEGANESEAPRAFKWRRRVYELDNSALTSKNQNT